MFFSNFEEFVLVVYRLWSVYRPVLNLRGFCLTRQAGAAAIDWSANRHDRILLLFKKPVSICGL